MSVPFPHPCSICRRGPVVQEASDPHAPAGSLGIRLCLRCPDKSHGAFSARFAWPQRADDWQASTRTLFEKWNALQVELARLGRAA